MEAFTRAMAEKDFNIMETQVIVPIKNVGSSCTYEINNAIQELYNPEDKKLKEVNGFSNGKPYVLRVGDKVMNMVNTYKTSPPIYNGNLGIIEDIYYDEDLDEEFMLINFKGIGEVKVPKDCASVDGTVICMRGSVYILSSAYIGNNIADTQHSNKY
jgi:ATP-dependent exoDNAse (exonuclease V) alpha subunit